MARKSNRNSLASATPESCRDESLPLRELGSFNLRPCEIEWLHLFRSLLAQPRENANAAFLDLHHRAEEYYGDETAPLIVGATTGLIRALKAERPAPFYFVSPHCAACRERVCEDEFLVLCAVVSARCGDEEQLDLAARQLTHAGTCDRVIRSARSLAQLLNLAGRQPAALWHSPTSGTRLH